MTTETFKLSEPLKTHDGVVSELTLKAPRTRSLIKWGDPFRIVPRTNDAGEPTADFVFDNKSMMGVLSDMTGIDDLLLSDISASDFWRLRSQAARMVLESVPDKDPSVQSAG